jgi:hypothetical protein
MESAMTRQRFRWRYLAITLTIFVLALAFSFALLGDAEPPPTSSAGTSLEPVRPRSLPSLGEFFTATWARTDQPVATGQVVRTWMWGTDSNGLAERVEPYVEATGGERVVRYFDKSRMEVTNPDGDSSDPWFVSNGLLVIELVTGRLQLGDDTFETRKPADVNVAGDADDPSGPTYATIALIRELPPLDDGEVVNQRLSRDGQITIEPGLTGYGVTAVHRVQVPGINHQIASPFWAFMNSSGPIVENGVSVDGPLFPNPFYATGYPITEAYWANVKVGGVYRDVLLQCFERRCLTYTPGNPPGFQTEAGNVGQHYCAWRYGSSSCSASPAEPTPVNTPAPIEETPTLAPGATTATPSEQPPAPSDPVLITVGEGAVDAWTRAIVRDSADRVWIVAANNNPAYQGTGAGELRVYKADQTGVPSNFTAVASATIRSSNGGSIPFSDAAIDGQDRLHVIWIDRGGAGSPVMYGVFDLAGESWSSPPSVVDLSNLGEFGGSAAQGGAAIALGPDGLARIAYCVADHDNQIRVRQQTATGWSDPQEPLRVDGAFVWHPALAIGADGVWHLAVYNATDLEILASSDTGSGWSSPVVVASNVLGPENIDQGPALLVDPSGVPMLTYLDSASFLRLSALTTDGWRDIPLNGDFFTHSPGLGVFADGSLIMAGHNEGWPPTALNAIQGREGAWGPWQPLVAVQADGSEVFRWAGHFSTPGAGMVDLVFFDEDTNDDGAFIDQTLYYVAVARTMP